MIPSIEGLLVCVVLFFIGYLMGAPFIIGLLASLPFGSTAFATVTALGGSSPLIYTLFSIGIIIASLSKKDVLRRLGIVFTRFPFAWVVVVLTGYAIVSAILFPRLFAGQTSAFISIEGLVTELPLYPNSGNITQTAYFTLGALLFIALSMILLQPENLRHVRRGFFAFATANAALGILDLAGKLSGAGDILRPIRTASYSLLTEVEQAGFWRIAGGFSEASGFAAMSLICLAFSYAYWRATKSRFVFWLMVVLLLLALLSTSTTAYAGLAILSLAPMAALAKAVLQNRFRKDDLILMVLGSVSLVMVGLIYLYSERIFDPITELVQTTIFDKSSSASGKERAYWNEKSLQSFFDTSGLGVGMGSSRSSSWIISVLSQLGVVGTLAILTLIVVMIRGIRGITPTPETQEHFALVAGVRAAAVALLVSGSISGTSADPGVLFFIALATILAARNACADNGAIRYGPHPSPQTVRSF